MLLCMCSDSSYHSVRHLFPSDHPRRMGGTVWLRVCSLLRSPPRRDGSVPSVWRRWGRLHRPDWICGARVTLERGGLHSIDSRHNVAPPTDFLSISISLSLSPSQNDLFQFEDVELSPDKEAVVVKAEFEPLVLDTMTKFGDKQEVGV